MNNIQNRQCHSNDICCVVRTDMFGEIYLRNITTIMVVASRNILTVAKSKANGLEFCKFVLKLDPNNTLLPKL